MGEAECQQTLARLVWGAELKEAEELESASCVLCEGDLRDQRGTKFHCLIFDVGFLVTRLDKRTDKLQVQSPIIPAADLELDEVLPLRTSRNCNIFIFFYYFCISKICY